MDIFTESQEFQHARGKHTSAQEEFSFAVQKFFLS